MVPRRAEQCHLYLSQAGDLLNVLRASTDLNWLFRTLASPIHYIAQIREPRCLYMQSWQTCRALEC